MIKKSNHLYIKCRNFPAFFCSQSLIKILKKIDSLVYICRKLIFMKKLYVFAGVLISATFYSQSLMGNLNSGGVSGQDLMYTVDEIYVIPDDPDQQNSGTLGMLYQTSLQVLGAGEVIVKQDKVNVYPNPTADYITLQIASKKKPKEVSVYDLSGKLVMQQAVSNDRLDLSSLMKGIYLLVFKNSDLKPVKIIKK